jgi:hypothetical protein
MIGHDEDIESRIGSYEDANEHVGATVPFVRRTTLPPSYEQSDSNVQPNLMNSGGPGNMDGSMKLSLPRFNTSPACPRFRRTLISMEDHHSGWVTGYILKGMKPVGGLRR